MSSPASAAMWRRNRGLCSEGWKIFRKIRRDWQPIVILTPDPGMARHRTFPVGCVGLRGKNFRSSRSIARIWGVRCAGSKSPLCLCVPATAACIMKMALALPDHHRAGSMSTNTRLSRQNCGCAAGSCRLYRNRFDTKDWSTEYWSDGVRHVVPNVQTVQAVQPPPPSSPVDAGEEQRWGLERSVAVELSEAIERIERFFMRNSDAEKNCPLDR